VSITTLSRYLLSWALSASWRIHRLYSHVGTEANSRASLELCSLLSRFPFWRDGHAALADLSLEAGDLAKAYASTQCVRILSGQSRTHERRWRHLLARCLLSTGRMAEALEELQRAEGLGPISAALVEDKAAALMALGRGPEAAESLSSLPLKALSPAAQMTLNYLKTKTEPPAA
jgi:hypothetical protein